MSSDSPIKPEPTKNTPPTQVATSLGTAGQKVTLPRTALERVLARATELQTHGADTHEVISEERLLEIGREVGIDPDHLRLAIAEERSRSPELPGATGRIIEALGDAHTAAQRAVTGSPDRVLSALDKWMQREEKFTVKRRFGDRMSWEAQRNPFASMSRSFRGKNADLARADEVSAVVTAVDGTRSLVRLDADLRGHRKAQRDGVVVMGAVNAVVAAGWATPMLVLMAVSPNPPNVAFAAVAGAVGLAFQAGISTLVWRGIRNSFRAAVARTQLRLEQLLDALEHGDNGSPPSLLEQLRQTLLPPKP